MPARRCRASGFAAALEIGAFVLLRFAISTVPSVRGFGGLADDDKGCPVFGISLFRVLVDHRQHGFAHASACDSFGSAASAAKVPTIDHHIYLSGVLIGRPAPNSNIGVVAAIASRAACPSRLETNKPSAKAVSANFAKSSRRNLRPNRFSMHPTQSAPASDGKAPCHRSSTTI